MTSQDGPRVYAEVANYAPPASEDELVEQYAPLVKRQAYHLAARLPETVQIDDLIQAGMIGLLEAARRYRSDGGARFETYATTRVRGAMVDALRPSDWTPRSVNRRAREMTGAVQRVEHRLGRSASDAEIMAEMGVDADTYHELVRDITTARVLSLDEVIDDGQAAGQPVTTDTPESQTAQQDVRRRIADAIHSLPEREQQILALYYDEELNLREIGQVLDVTESRVSQIHGRALVRLRARVMDEGH